MTDAPDPEITFYWRPGCGFCSSLRHQLAGSDLVVHERDIWADPEAAAVVRSYARGNETVPTVVVGSPGEVGSVGLVNPTLGEVLAAARRESGSRA